MEDAAGIEPATFGNKTGTSVQFEGCGVEEAENDDEEADYWTVQCVTPAGGTRDRCL